MAAFYQHEHVRIAAAFSDVSGQPADPTADVEYLIVEPDGTVVSLTYSGADIIKSGTGSYYYDLLADQYGQYLVWVKGEGALDTVERSEFTVLKSIDGLS